jgi:hypothetical protein
VPRDGLLRGARHQAALRADPLARNEGLGLETRPALIDLHVKTNFLNRINVIWVVQSSGEK